MGLNKTTTGTVTIGGAASYTGPTSVTAGTLAYGINNAIPTASAITVNGTGAALALSGFNGTAGTTTLQGTGSITGPGTLTVNTANTFELQSGTVTAVLAGTGAMNKTHHRHRLPRRCRHLHRCDQHPGRNPGVRRFRRRRHPQCRCRPRRP